MPQPLVPSCTITNSNHHVNVSCSRESVLRRLWEALLRKSLTKIDLSQRGLVASDARLVKMALLQNRHKLIVLKLGYNHLGDVGVALLADGIGTASFPNLQSLDLGFNHIGDIGCASLCRAIATHRRLHTLYLAGNLIGQDGAMAIADLIHTNTSRLQKLYLTGNLLGPEGVKAIVDAIIDKEQQLILDDNPHVSSRNNGEFGVEKHGSAVKRVTLHHHQQQHQQQQQQQQGSMEELYLGGSGMGTVGCQYIARLLEKSHRIRVLSLPNCEITDESLLLLASSIKANRERLVLESLQLSFNRITCRGIECLVNAVWGTRTLKELLLDNNEIADRGAQHIAAVLLPHVKTLETINVGFNLIHAQGIKILMKAVVDTGCTLLSLSVSGNTVDTSAAKAISYALAYSRSLQSLSLVHCNIGHEGQRHISAGIVSNSRTKLRELSGFHLGPVIVTLGFPSALEHWSNGQILHFLSAMWNHHHRANTMSALVGSHIGGGGGGGDLSLAPNERYSSTDDNEKLMDPLNFLGTTNSIRSAPEDAAIVVEVANKAFSELVERDGGIYSTSKRETNVLYPHPAPRVNDDTSLTSLSQTPFHLDRDPSKLPAHKVASFVASPEVLKQMLPDPARKKRIADWLSANIKDVTKLAQQPFNSGELWRLHQHYFTPVVNESGGESMALSPRSSIATTMSSVPNVSTGASSKGPSCFTKHDPNGIEAGTQMASFPILKRKVSYRFLGDAAAFTSVAGMTCRNESVVSASGTPQSVVSILMESGRVVPTTTTTPNKNTKRARRNRSRISFLPRVQAELDSYLDVDHEHALVTMRQLYFVERAILSGQIHPILDDATQLLTHLCGDWAMDAETIVVDMM